MTGGSVIVGTVELGTVIAGSTGLPRDESVLAGVLIAGSGASWRAVTAVVADDLSTVGMLAWTTARRVVE